MQTGPGQLFVGSTQRFLHDNLLGFLRCNHSIRYAAARGPQPQLVQHLQASAVSSAFDPETQALRYELTAALRAGEAPSFTSTPTAPAKTSRGRGSGQLTCTAPLAATGSLSLPVPRG